MRLVKFDSVVKLKSAICVSDIAVEGVVVGMCDHYFKHLYSTCIALWAVHSHADIKNGTENCQAGKHFSYCTASGSACTTR